MHAKRWNERFFASTRGRIVALLRRSARTVNELADELELTDNAVRSHLSGLERDGLVEQEGVRRGMGKPAVVYRLTAEAEALFPKAYSFVLGEVLSALKDRIGPDELAALLAEVGHRAGSAGPGPEGDPRTRLAFALAVLAESGGDAEVLELAEGKVLVRGFSCPLGAVVTQHPSACKLTEALLSELVGLPVHEECDRGERPRCAFRVELEAEK
jgi:predicted ArsR family transcriptional regulator